MPQKTEHDERRPEKRVEGQDARTEREREPALREAERHTGSERDERKPERRGNPNEPQPKRPEPQRPAEEKPQPPAEE